MNKIPLDLHSAGAVGVGEDEIAVGPRKTARPPRVDPVDPFSAQLECLSSALLRP